MFRLLTIVVKVSVPCSGSIINRRLLETKGIQDAESFFIGGLSNGISLKINEIDYNWNIAGVLKAYEPEDN